MQLHFAIGLIVQTSCKSIMMMQEASRVLCLFCKLKIDRDGESYWLYGC